MKFIYIYTSQIYKQKNWYKVGESIKDPAKRIQQQDNASNPEPLIFVAAWLVPNKLTDKKVHAKLQNLGFLKLRQGREWFELSDIPENDVSEAISLCTNDFSKHDTDTINIPDILKNHLIPDYSELWWHKKS